MSEIVTLRGQRHAVTECGTCGVVFTVPEVVYEQHRQEGGYHHCPNGHTWGWAKDRCERERLRQERDRLKQQLAEKDDQIVHKERQLADREFAITKLKKRAAVGVCPCCTRSFANLRRHMAAKHPSYAEAAE